MDSLAGEMVGSATKTTESIVSGRDGHVAYLQNRRSMIFGTLEGSIRLPHALRCPSFTWRRLATTSAISGAAKKCERRCAEQPVEHFPSPENRALVLPRDRAAPLLRASEEWSPANEQAMLVLAPVSVSVAQVTIAC